MHAPIRQWKPRDSGWPTELSQIPSPPDQLWSRGLHELLGHTPRIAIVGSRSPTPYGEGQARRFAHALASRGITVVSGMARGVDHAAHLAALDVGGRTIAVLGCGVDRPWPAGPLVQRILSEGMVLSEFEPGRAPRRHHFPLRNRIISGLACAVIVVEAAHNSGSLITAHWALDQGRMVYALPGRVDHPMARGCHRLIREGARLLESPEDVLQELQEACLWSPGDPDGGIDIPENTSGTPAQPHPILGALRGETLGVNELCSLLGLPTERVLAELTQLELASAVVRAPGGLYRLSQSGA